LYGFRWRRLVKALEIWFKFYLCSCVTYHGYVSVMRNVRWQRVLGRVDEPDALDLRRVADVVLALILLAITAPLMLLVALAIQAESLGPIFEQERCLGKGRRFERLKFRTKPTHLGRVLRYTRIETLPRLINVLRGEMSIMDPRGSLSFLDQSSTSKHQPRG
jgi:lipopolysaccharide/colanic/teichoic acid biosynthesis glycosyltransferase